MCDYIFKKKNLRTTSFHQMKDIATYVTGKSSDMIADLGCPNSVIGRKDKENFMRHLSGQQRKNLHVVEVDENFKFGPSGPFRCKEKLRFQIDIDQQSKWVEVAIVDADIPMLLGNNILKPLEAEIKLFREGHGMIKLGDVKLDMTETKGGHYTVKVQELSKLNNIEIVNAYSFYYSR
jgi:hypothetical protein